MVSNYLLNELMNPQGECGGKEDQATEGLFSWEIQWTFTMHIANLSVVFTVQNELCLNLKKMEEDLLGWPWPLLLAVPPLVKGNEREFAPALHWPLPLLSKPLLFVSNPFFHHHHPVGMGL